MKIRFEADGFELTPELEKYASKRARFAARKLPRAVRTQADCAYHFAQVDGVVACAMALTVGGETFAAEEATQHAYSSLDVVAAHVEHQLEAYIAWHGSKHDWRLP